MEDDDSKMNSRWHGIIWIISSTSSSSMTPLFGGVVLLPALNSRLHSFNLLILRNQLRRNLADESCAGRAEWNNSVMSVAANFDH